VGYELLLVGGFVGSLIFAIYDNYNIGDLKERNNLGYAITLIAMVLTFWNFLAIAVEIGIVIKDFYLNKKKEKTLKDLEKYKITINLD